MQKRQSNLGTSQLLKMFQWLRRSSNCQRMVKLFSCEFDLWRLYMIIGYSHNVHEWCIRCLPLPHSAGLITQLVTGMTLGLLGCLLLLACSVRSFSTGFQIVN